MLDEGHTHTHASQSTHMLNEGQVVVLLGLQALVALLISKQVLHGRKPTAQLRAHPAGRHKGQGQDMSRTRQWKVLGVTFTKIDQ